MNLTYPEGCSRISTLDILHDNQLIGDEVAFLGCLPHCGLCDHSMKEGHYVMYNLILSGIILPLIGFLGLIGNGLSAFVYSRPEMRCSTNWYLCALGCSDSAVIVTGIFLFFIESVRKFSLTLTRIFGAVSPIVYPLGMAAQTCSVYFTIFAGFDCFAQVCLPEKIRERVSRTRTVQFCIIFVLAFAVLYNIPHCFEATVVDCYHVGFNGPSWEVCPEPIRYNEMYLKIYYQYMYSIFLAVGPLVFLIVLNTFIICVSMFGSGGSGADDTMSLVLVVLLFIACNVAALLLNTFESSIEDILGPHINYIVDLSNLLVVFNSSFSATLKKYCGGRNVKSECGVPGPPLVITDKSSSRNKICKETIGRLLNASQPEVLI